MSPSKQDILSEYYGHDQSVARKLGIALDVVKPFPNHLHIMSQEETGRPRTSSSQVWWSPELESWDHLTTAFENNEDCVYDTLLPFVDSYVPEIVVPEVETTNLEHSPSAVSEHSPNCISSASSSVVSSALTPSLPYRRLTKEDIEAGTLPIVDDQSDTNRDQRFKVAKYCSNSFRIAKVPSSSSKSNCVCLFPADTISGFRLTITGNKLSKLGRINARKNFSRESKQSKKVTLNCVVRMKSSTKTW